MDTLEAIRSRTSANNFDPTHELSNSEIEELIALGQEAPTSFNLQNWKAVVFRSKQIKDEVKAAAWGQAKVSDAAVSILFVGILDGHKEANRSAKTLATPYRWRRTDRRNGRRFGRNGK